MGNSTRIAGALVILFVIYITARGELATYLKFFSFRSATVANGGSASNVSTAPTGSSVADSLNSALSGVQNFGSEVGSFLGLQ